MNFRRFREDYGKPWFQAAIKHFGIGSDVWHSKIAEEILIKLESQTEAHLKFWKEFQSYLANQREQKIEEIKESLWSARTHELDLSDCSRIVDSEWANRPLSSKGSVIKKPGGRFNFGGISSFHADFEALYLASNYQTAFLEKFHKAPDDLSENEKSTLFPQDLALTEINGFTHFKVGGRLRSVLDLRNPEPLQGFVEIISKIDSTEFFESWAKREKIKFGMLTNLNQFINYVNEPNYTQWAVWLEQPSISQWLGHYARLAGISAIVYGSVRNPQDGINFAVLPNNLESTGSYIETLGLYHGAEVEWKALNLAAKDTDRQGSLFGNENEKK